ncbi:hypothetical protein Tco_0922576 [Tanacetum coccineum]|uniref:Uncharacterized protein n=1 Tax=Tanacetum coccineum TaxID=301880 RepID=A0ABQ5CZY3_9ASTR
MMVNDGTKSDPSLEEQQGKCSNQRDDTKNEDVKISKDASEIDKVVARASNDKDNTTEECVTNKDNKALKEANDLLTKELKKYKEQLYHATSLHDENVHACVYDSEETFDDAEKSRLKIQEIQKYENFQELKIKPIDYMRRKRFKKTIL